jgi:threonine dehydrogenase-like Zn-dependent dehydrogenase
MKALQILTGNKLELVSKNQVPLAPWEARLSVVISLVCGSDIKNIRLPSSVDRVPGHEFSGVVTEVSHESNGILKIGERVSAFPMMPCHLCENCQKRIFRDCEFKESLGTIKWPGSFASEIIIDARMAVILPHQITMEQGALLEHLCCGYRFAIEIVESGIPLDSHILVIGDGPIALANLQMLLLRGFKNVTIIGKHPFRLKVAEDLGARKVFNLIDLGNESWDLIDVIDVCVLSAPSEEIFLSLSSRFAKGAVVIEQTRFFDFDLKDSMISRGFEFRRAFAYQLADFTSVALLIIKRKIETSYLISSRLTLEEFGSGYPEVLAKHQNIKIAIISDEDLFKSRNEG